MSKKSTKLKNILSEHHILGELPSSKLMKMKWNPVTGETMNEDDTNEYGSPSMGSMSSSDEKAPRMKTSKETENIKKVYLALSGLKKAGGSGRYGKEFDSAKKRALKAMNDMLTYSKIGE